MEGVETEVRATLLNHLANCIVSTGSGNSSPELSPNHVDSSMSSSVSSMFDSVIMNNVKSPQKSGEFQICMSDLGPSISHAHQIVPYNVNECFQHSTQSAQPFTLVDGTRFGAIDQSQNRIPTYVPITQAPVNIQSMVAGQTFQVQAPQGQAAVQTTVQAQPTFVMAAHNQLKPQTITSTVQPSQVQIQKVMGGLQLLPTRMASGEMAFIIPANIIASSAQTQPNYVMSVGSSKGISVVTDPNIPLAVSCPEQPGVGYLTLSNKKITPPGQRIATAMESSTNVTGLRLSNITDSSLSSSTADQMHRVMPSTYVKPVGQLINTVREILPSSSPRHVLMSENVPRNVDTLSSGSRIQVQRTIDSRSLNSSQRFSPLHTQQNSNIRNQRSVSPVQIIPGKEDDVWRPW